VSSFFLLSCQLYRCALCIFLVKPSWVRPLLSLRQTISCWSIFHLEKQSHMYQFCVYICQCQFMEYTCEYPPFVEQPSRILFDQFLYNYHSGHLWFLCNQFVLISYYSSCSFTPVVQVVQLLIDLYIHSCRIMASAKVTFDIVVMLIVCNFTSCCYEHIMTSHMYLICIWYV